MQRRHTAMPYGMSHGKSHMSNLQRGGSGDDATRQSRKSHTGTERRACRAILTLHSTVRLQNGSLTRRCSLRLRGLRRVLCRTDARFNREAAKRLCASATLVILDFFGKTRPTTPVVVKTLKRAAAVPATDAASPSPSSSSKHNAFAARKAQRDEVAGTSAGSKSREPDSPSTPSSTPSSSKTFGWTPASRLLRSTPPSSTRPSQASVWTPSSPPSPCGASTLPASLWPPLPSPLPSTPPRQPSSSPSPSSQTPPTASGPPSRPGRFAPRSFSLRAEGTGNRGLSRHGHLAKVAGRKVLGLPAPLPIRRLERSQVAGAGSYPGRNGIKKVKVVIKHTFYKPSKTDPRQYWYWCVSVNGYGRDVQKKKTNYLKLVFATEREAKRCQAVWKRLIAQHHALLDFKEIRNLVREVVYPLEVQEQLDGGRRFNFQNHGVESILRHRRCQLFRDGVCTVRHVCFSCKRIVPCMEVGVEVQCFDCSIRRWGQIWGSSKLEDTVKLIAKRDARRSGAEESLSITEAGRLHADPHRRSPFAMSAARFLHEQNDAAKDELVAVLRRVMRGGAVGSLASDPTAVAVAEVDRIGETYAFSLFLNVKERLTAFSPSIDLRYQVDGVHRLESCWVVPRWYNLAKKHGLGVMVELTILAAQLRHSHSQGRLPAALADIARLAARLQPLDEVSQEWHTLKGQAIQGRQRLVLAEQIEIVEQLFHGRARDAVDVVHALADGPYTMAITNNGVTVKELRKMWPETSPAVQGFVQGFVEPFLAAHAHTNTLKRNGDGFPTFFWGEDTSTKEVCEFLFGRGKRAREVCDRRNTKMFALEEEQGEEDSVEKEGAGHGSDGHRWMGPLAVAAYMLMSAAEATAGDAVGDPFDGQSLPDAWSGLPLFSGPTTLIAHKDHGRFFHLGFETNAPRYGDWQPDLVNARMELYKSNWMVQALRVSTLVAILQATRQQCRMWLAILVRVGLVERGAQEARQALQGELDVESVVRHFGTNGVSTLELGWSRRRLLLGQGKEVQETALYTGGEDGEQRIRCRSPSEIGFASSSHRTQTDQARIGELASLPAKNERLYDHGDLLDAG
ncbi:hypothetical protein PHSY_006611 [Pseudozyma hubeiensis SY62]|uniref:Uncharacterized protein n=1 Tax=Pseudozyma hubeiensis (strain SY62) TaxID=1305764 RepID=R9PCD1_PSEHS|nr:hypothetical protein PHSY_006611 [Pseudozyma hubeiensis SY62]GAC99014.1 hypothetical protein PHSY_006611 [Pseudozyma hubeiensis SY62]